jgi:hypothetical protein
MPFTERTFWVYPWDLMDADPSQRLTEIRDLGATAISIPFSYHSLRAFAPHRTGRRVINTSAAIYFRPRPGEFPLPGLQPDCSEWASDEGPVRNLAALAREAGLRVCAWTVVFHNSPLATAHPDCVVMNCFGDVFTHALCPTAPKARDYALSLVQAVSRRPVDAIELEAAGFYGYDHLSHHDKCGIAFDLFHHFLFSCCFCSHCRQRLKAAGVDSDFVARRFRRRLSQFFEGKVPAISDAQQAAMHLNELLGEDVARATLRTRSETILGLISQIRKIVPPKIELAISSGLSPFEFGALFGAEPRDTLRIADRLLLVVFDPNRATFEKRFEAAARCFPDRSRWIAGIRIFPPDACSEDEVESRIRFLSEKGFGAVHLYHYGLAPRHLLAAAGRALKRPEGGID